MAVGGGAQPRKRARPRAPNDGSPYALHGLLRAGASQAACGVRRGRVTDVEVGASDPMAT